MYIYIYFIYDNYNLSYNMALNSWKRLPVFSVNLFKCLNILEPKHRYNIHKLQLHLRIKLRKKLMYKFTSVRWKLSRRLALISWLAFFYNSLSLQTLLKLISRLVHSFSSYVLSCLHAVYLYNIISYYLISFNVICVL